MKQFITNLALFMVFAIAFSSFNACKTTQQTATNDNAVNAPANANTEKTDSKSSDYPPLPVAIADADIELVDGTVTKVSGHKGKVLLLDLWGIWCGPCVAEMPHLAQLQAAYADKGFEVIGLNIGDQDGGPEDLGKIKAFAEKLQINYTIGRIQNTTTGQFYRVSRQQAVPQTFLVDREGHLRGVFVGGGPKVLNSIMETVEKTMSE